MAGGIVVAAVGDVAAVMLPGEGVTLSRPSGFGVGWARRLWMPLVVSVVRPVPGVRLGCLRTLYRRSCVCNIGISIR